MVTLKDISARCGVSRATVSKALNNHKDIGKETGERIRQTAKEMGYLPNAAARALKTNRTNNLGVLFIDQMMSGLAHEYFSSMLESFKVEGERLGYDITFISQNIGGTPMSYLEHCRYRNCDGVMIASVDFNDPMVVELIQSDIPIVTIDHVFNSRTAILSNNVQGLHDLVSYIHSLGHRKIAYIHGEDTAVTQKRLGGFYRSCAELGVDVPDGYVKSARYHDPRSSGIATRELLAMPYPPTCIIYPDDFSFIGGMNEIERHGLRIPKDISVAGYDGIYLSQVLRPRLTTIHQDTPTLGREAAIRLVEAIEQPKLAFPRQIVVDGKLLKGDSVQQI